MGNNNLANTHTEKYLHAFIIMFHNNFEQLKMFLKFVDKQENLIILGIDRKAHKDDIREDILSCIKNAKAIYAPIHINWAGYSQIDSTLYLLKKSLEYTYQYVHFITGVDVPLMDYNYFKDFFQKNYGKQFIDFCPQNYEFASYKCNYYHLFVENKRYRTNRFIKFLNHSVVRLQKFLHIKRTKRKFYHGSAYFSITQDFAHFILEKYSEIKKTYKYTLGADEVWLQTLTMSSPYKYLVYNFEKSNGNARYIDWTRRNGNSPHTFTMKDIKEIVSILNTEFAFARKFDFGVDKEIINEIYKRIGN